MKLQLSNIISLIALSTATQVRYDKGYDDASRSLDTAACSNGANGIITKYNYTTQGQIPVFPNIGSSDTIASWNSPNCGTCFNVLYGSNSLYFLALDVARVDGIVMSQVAMDQLTNSQAVAVGVVDATVTPVDVSHCISKAQ